MSSTRKLVVEIAGEDRGAGKAFKQVGDDADKLGVRLKKSGKTSGSSFSSGFMGEMPKAASMASIGEKVAKAFKAAAVGLAVGAGAAFSLAFMDGMDKEFAVDKLEAQLGGGQWGEMAGKIAGDLYLEAFGDSIGEVGAVVRDVMQSGILAKDAGRGVFEDLSRRVLTFADVLDQDANMTVQALTSMLTSGIARDGTHALDVLTRGVQEAGGKSGDLLETFQEYSTLFRSLGLSADDALGLMIQGLRHGARDTDKLADAIGEFMKKAVDGSELTADAFTRLGLPAEKTARLIAGGGEGARKAFGQVLDKLREVEDPLERSQISFGLFGTQFEDLQDALFALDLGTAATGLGQVAGATDDLATAYNNAKTKVEAFRRQAMEQLTIFVANQVLPRLAQLWEFVQRNEKVFIVLAGVVGGVLLVATLAFAAAMTKAAIATVITLAPILLIVAALAALAAGVVWAYQNWDWFREAVDRVGSFLTGTLWPALRNVAGFIMVTLVPAVSRVIERFSSWATTVATVVWQVVNHLDGLITFVKGIPGAISGIATGMWDALKNGLDAAVRWVKDRLDTLLGPLQAILDRVSLLRQGVTVGGNIDEWGSVGAKLKAKAGATKRALGGPVMAGRPYIVGEHRPELFVPNTNGQILPRVPDDRPAIHIDNVTLGNGASVADLAAELTWMWRVAG